MGIRDKVSYLGIERLSRGFIRDSLEYSFYLRGSVLVFLRLEILLVSSELSIGKIEVTKNVKSDL